MGPNEYQRRLDERYAVEVAMRELISQHSADLRALSRIVLILHERIEGAEKVLEEILRKEKG